MEVINNELILSETDINNFCKNCGACCIDMYLEDKLDILFNSGRFLGLSKICKYYKEGCSIQNNKPRCCVDYYCGGFKVLKEKLKGKINGN